MIDQDIENNEAIERQSSKGNEQNETAKKSGKLANKTKIVVHRSTDIGSGNLSNCKLRVHEHKQKESLNIKTSY